MYRRFLLLLAVLFVLFYLPDAARAESPAVVINELLWMGSPQSAQDEWVELFNTTAQDINLAGWKLTKLSSDTESDMVVLPPGTLPANGYFLIANYGTGNENTALLAEPDLVDTGVSLVNSKLRVRLYNPDGVLVDAADDGIGAPFAGSYVSATTWASMERHRRDIPGTDAAAWHTASVAYSDHAGFFATPGTANSNRLPEILCDGPTEVPLHTEAAFTANATDPDGDALTVFWEFSGKRTDGSTATYSLADEGEMILTCSAQDGKDTATDSIRVFVRDDASVVPVPVSPSETPQPSGTVSSKTNTAVTNAASSDRVLLTALLPNPLGQDATEEFIELTNFADTDVDLKEWALTDGSRTYRFRTSTILAARGTLQLTRQTTGIALNNSGDTIHVIDPFGTKVNGVAYGSAPDGELFLRDGETPHWSWTGSEEANTDTENTTGETVTKADESIRDVHIRDLAFLPLKTKIHFTGVLIALPGQLLADTLFVAADDAMVRVYSSTGRFPGSLALGTSVQVTGELASDRLGEKVNLGRDGVVEKVETTVLEAYVETITGTVQEKNRTLLTLETENGAVPVRIKNGTGITMDTLTSGSAVCITGFYFSGEFLPRTSEDIQVQAGEVLGSTTNSAPEQTTPAVDTPFEVPESSNSFSAIAVILSGVLVALGGALFWRHRRNTGYTP